MHQHQRCHHHCYHSMVEFIENFTPNRMLIAILLCTSVLSFLLFTSFPNKIHIFRTLASRYSIDRINVALNTSALKTLWQRPFVDIDNNDNDFRGLFYVLCDRTVFRVCVGKINFATNASSIHVQQAMRSKKSACVSKINGRRRTKVFLMNCRMIRDSRSRAILYSILCNRLAFVASCLSMCNMLSKFISPTEYLRVSEWVSMCESEHVWNHLKMRVLNVTLTCSVHTIQYWMKIFRYCFQHTKVGKI